MQAITVYTLEFSRTEFCPAVRDSTNQKASFVEWFSRLDRAVFRGIRGEIFALFQACVGNFDTIPPRKVVGTLNLDSICVVLNILLSWAFATTLNCSVMCKPPWWFECYLRRSSSIHCWLVLAVYRIISVNFLLQPFFFVNFGVYSGLPLLVSPFTMRRWKCLGMKRLSQPSSTSPGKRTEKLAEAKADVKRVMQNPGRVCFILNQKR